MHLHTMNIHFIGIGGHGMSSLAEHYLRLGYTITGSDRAKTDITMQLETLGITIFYEHKSTNIPMNTVLVVYSIYIADDNNELQYARNNDIQCLTYVEAVGGLTHKYRTIAICGTHGKSTTTAFTGLLLEHLGIDCTVLGGAFLPQWNNRNYRYGSSDWLVLEACEWRQNFLHYTPEVAICTNIELDHIDYYMSDEHYDSAFKAFFERCKYVIYHENDSRTEALIPLEKRIKAPTQIANTLDIHALGRHNKDNATLAYTLATSVFNATDKDIRDGLQRFRGIYRRQEYIGRYNNIRIFDDYAHHPTAVYKTLEAFRSAYPTSKIGVLWELHGPRFSMLDEFCKSLRSINNTALAHYKTYIPADFMPLTDPDIAISDALPESTFISNDDELKRFIENNLTDNDIIICFSAGRASDVIRRIVDK